MHQIPIATWSLLSREFLEGKSLRDIPEISTFLDRLVEGFNTFSPENREELLALPITRSTIVALRLWMHAAYHTVDTNWADIDKDDRLYLYEFINFLQGIERLLDDGNVPHMTTTQLVQWWVNNALSA